MTVTSYEREDVIYDPLHYLSLLERKPGALDRAAPLAQWVLPEAFLTLRRLLESRLGRAGKREFIQVLRLHETFSTEQVQRAVLESLKLSALSYDAIKHLLLAALERRPARFDLDAYPYLPRAEVLCTRASEVKATETSQLSSPPGATLGQAVSRSCAVDQNTTARLSPIKYTRSDFDTALPAGATCANSDEGLKAPPNNRKVALCVYCQVRVRSAS